MLVALGLLVTLPVQAQVFKCKGPTGMVYQAAPCDGGRVVENRMSSGVTGLKQDADREAARQQEQRAGAAFNPSTCKFQYHALGDDLGESLAAAAKEECLSTRGKLGPAYERWQNHYQTESARRSGILSRSQQQQQLQQQQLQRVPSQSLRCKKNYLGGMDCEPR
ncbi:MAG: hypothetical protein A3H27_06585 [Acidobacteria bacterium RIFCSPLOWO2_02_FULL_59_13]|nr:MAG: hypothetical protein A3H27_06585 [Acidobacteria bacterium RIFCSPLOWO2_02_FULL_59_13]